MKAVRDHDTTKRFPVRLVESTRITSEASREEVRNLVFKTELEVKEFEDCESVGVLLRGSKEIGNPLLHRLYTIAGVNQGVDGGTTTIELCVRRCFYIDDFNGERYPGPVSNYLCDLEPGTEIELTGPFGAAFPTPEDKSANLLMICLGTGIAPFRALSQRIYRDVGEWEGQVRLFHGALTGLELLYRNDEKEDFAYYYDEKTFKAIEALSPRPHVGEPVALDRALEENAAEVWYLLQEESAHLYIAGLEKMMPQLEQAFRKIAGSDERWERLKTEMIRTGRWFEILY